MNPISRLQAIEKILSGEWEGAIDSAGAVITTYDNFRRRRLHNPCPAMQNSTLIYLSAEDSLDFSSDLVIAKSWLSASWCKFNYVTAAVEEEEAKPSCTELLLSAVSKVACQIWRAAKNAESRAILVRYDTYCKAMGVNPLSRIHPSQVIVMSHGEDLNPEFRPLLADYTLSTQWEEYELQNDYNLDPRDCIAALLKDVDLEFEYEVNHAKYRIDYHYFMTHGINPAVFKTKWKKVI